MSDLFVDMHRRRHNRLADSCSNSSFNTSACSDHRGPAAAFDASEHDANEVDDEISNILSLKLKKPKHWKWELTTSRSCMNIALPRILLYDHTGQLLIDANSQAEEVYKSAEDIPAPRKQSRKRTNRAATANLAQSIREVLNQEFDGLQIQEATPSLQSPATSSHQTRNSSPLASSSCIDFYTNDLPDYKFERRSSSLKGVRFKDDDTKSSGNSFQINGLPTPPPSSGTTPTTGTSSSSGPREKRRYRRSHSSGRSPVNSPSILERFSYSRGRFSSPEYAEEHEVYQPPRYFLRTSKAGTLVVQEESFSRCRRRPPRPKNSSSENLRYDNQQSPRSLSTSSLKMPTSSKHPSTQFLAVQHSPSVQAGSLQNVAEMRRKKKSMPIRRFRSDGNVLLQAANCSSSDEEAPEMPPAGNQRPRHRYDHHKRHLKGELVIIDPDNGVFRPYGSPTER